MDEMTDFQRENLDRFVTKHGMDQVLMVLAYIAGQNRSRAAYRQDFDAAHEHESWRRAISEARQRYTKLVNEED